jgi:hypothetical protein
MRRSSHLRSLSLRVEGFSTLTLALMLDSLVRVSRRAASDHYASILARGADLGPARGIGPRAITLPGELRSRGFSPPLGADAGLKTARSAPARTLGDPGGTVLVVNASLSTISRAFNSLFKVLFIFRSLYLCAIGLWPVFSFRRHLPPV